MIEISVNKKNPVCMGVEAHWSSEIDGECIEFENNDELFFK